MKVIRRMQKERLAEVGLDYEPSFGESRFSCAQSTNSCWYSVLPRYHPNAREVYGYSRLLEISQHRCLDGNLNFCLKPEYLGLPVGVKICAHF